MFGKLNKWQSITTLTKSSTVFCFWVTCKTLALGKGVPLALTLPLSTPTLLANKVTRSEKKERKRSRDYDGRANIGSYWLAMSEINAKTITAVKDVTHWNATRRPEKNSGLPGLEPWLLQYWCSALTKWATKTTGSWLLNCFVYTSEKWRWNNEYMNC